MLYAEMGPPGVRKLYFACDLNTFNGRNMHFPDIFLSIVTNARIIFKRHGFFIICNQIKKSTDNSLK